MSHLLTYVNEAVAIREKSPDDLWELAQARERLGETLLKAGSVAAPDLSKNAAHDLETQLGADHPQTLRAKVALSRVRASPHQPWGASLHLKISIDVVFWSVIR